MKPNYFFSNSEATLTASQLYKKFLMLLLVMVVGVSGAWGIGISKEVTLPNSDKTYDKGTWTSSTKTLGWTEAWSNTIDITDAQDLSAYKGITIDCQDLTSGATFRCLLTSGSNSYEYVMTSSGVHQILFSDFKKEGTAISDEELKSAKIQLAGRYGNNNKGSVRINRLGLISVKWWNEHKVTIEPSDFTMFGTTANVNDFTFNASWNEVRIFLDGTYAYEIGSASITTTSGDNVYISGWMSGQTYYSTLGEAKAAGAKITEIRIQAKSTGTYNISSVVINQPYEITYNTSANVPDGCEWWYTEGSDETKIKETRKIAPGAKITFHSSVDDSHMLNRWVDANNSNNTLAWNDAEYTVNSLNADINYYPEFCDAYYIKAAATEGGTAKVTTGSSDDDISNVKQKSVNDVPQVTYTAQANSGYSFAGWYNGGNLVSNNNPYTFTPGSKETITLTAHFTKDKKITDKPGCGGVYLAQSNLNAGSGVTSLNIDGEGHGTVITSDQGGYVSFNFAEGYNLTELYKWAINCDNNSNVWYVAFCKNGEIIRRSSDNKEMQFYTNATDRTLENEYKSVLTSVDEIRIGFNSNTTTKINYFFLQTKPDVMFKVPTLASPTTTEMTLFQGETLKLRITDTYGFWREYTDGNYNVENNTRIANNAFSPSYDFADLPIGNYYFRVRHGGNCELGHYHETDPVDVHVVVKKAIKSIEVNGTTREYDVYAPDGISGTVGVVISLHGANNDYDNGRVDFNSIADTEKDGSKKFVVVYPRGLNHQEIWGGARSWETYDEESTNDTEFFKAIVNNLNQTFNGQFSIDYNRIYLAGFSNGGMMAYKAAHKDGDFYAACASVGGFPVNESHLWHAGSKPVPFVHIHGEKDNVVTLADYNIDAIVHNMVYRNGAKFNPNIDKDNGMVTDHANVTKDCHAAEVGGAAYYYYKIKDMWHSDSHDWDGDGQDDIAKTMWAFFNQSGIRNNIDPTLKFRIYDTANFWNLAGDCGFDNKNTGTSVLSYGGYTKNDANKNVYHSLQFNGGINGAPHYLKLNVYTEDVGGAAYENSAHYFLVKLTKTGGTTPVFAKRYQAGRGTKDLYINFSALPGLNEYKLEITKSSSGLTVQVNGVEFHSGKSDTENPTYYFDVASILKGMNPIYQPVLDKTWDGIAKEYLPIADIPVGGSPLTIEDNIKVNQEPKSSIPSTLVNNWNGANEATITGQQFLNIAKSGKSGEDTDHKSNNACILVRDGDGDTHNYIIDKTKGIKISQFGRAQMPEYLNGTRGNFPTHGVIAIKVQGTIDFTLLAQNDKTYPSNNSNAGRSTLKVYYTNDQLNNELKELKNWWFFGTRGEGNTSDSNNNLQAPLSVNVRLPQLGSDGTCTLFITYEGKNEWYPYEDEDANNHVWIKGFVIKRPDLKVTIGRTDRKYEGQTYYAQNNTSLTRFGENKPYIWSFENVGFNNTKLSDLNTKKVNSQDARTYVSGGTDDENNHLLLFSDISSGDDNDKVQFDGRVAGQEHIELQKPSKYDIPSEPTNRRLYNPITSNGLKVNVTGSGWFKIQCAAPNGPVNMKVYSQTNYGTSYMNLLREFRIEKSSSETDWKEYTVYLKGHVNRDGNNGFWDGVPNSEEDKKANAEEILQMSLFVVFDEIDGVDYKDNGVAANAQLNIHQLSWLNEEPADYVFQREEDPKLLTTWQAIRRDESGKKSTSESDPVILWWMAGSELKEKKDGNTIETYNPAAQFTTTAAANGVKSPGGYASTSVPSDAGTYNAYWDIAAPAATNAHTEAAYAKGGSDFTPEKEYIYNSGNNTEFDIPISGSFIRICAMKNTYVAAHVLPSAANAKVYVVDETGSPIPYKPSGADNPDSKTRGYVAALENLDFGDNTAVSKAGTTMRIDFCANAGKEYFICAKGASISLARLEAQDWRYKPMKSGTKLALTDNSNNSSNITNAYNTGEFYRDATLPRSLTANQWASIVLPFSLNEKKFEEVFGVGAKCLHFTDVDKENNTVKLTHHFYNMIVAGRPIFIRPSKDVTNLEITDVTLQANVVKNTTTTNGFEFFGSYDNSTINNNDIYLSTGNTFKYLKTSDGNSKTYPGMRSFIKSPSGYNPSGAAAVSSAKAIFVNYDDENLEDATGIEELISSEFGENTIIVRKSTKVYDLNGRVVANATDFENLPSGIYIVNGKKYVK